MNRFEIIGMPRRTTYSPLDIKILLSAIKEMELANGWVLPGAPELRNYSKVKDVFFYEHYLFKNIININCMLYSLNTI